MPDKIIFHRYVVRELASVMVCLGLVNKTKVPMSVLEEARRPHLWAHKWENGAMAKVWRVDATGAACC